MSWRDNTRSSMGRADWGRHATTPTQRGANTPQQRVTATTQQRKTSTTTLMTARVNNSEEKCAGGSNGTCSYSEPRVRTQ